eukprot:8645818-Alexandrium_andersonii.AAC.1
MVFAKRLNANDGHMAQLGNLMTKISASQPTGEASASAEGGGGGAPAGAPDDVVMVVPSAASADGGGGVASAPQ